MASELRPDAAGAPRGEVQASAGAGAPEPGAAKKVRAAALSVISNSALILLKVVAGTLTGSVAILTEALTPSLRCGRHPIRRAARVLRLHQVEAG